MLSVKSFLIVILCLLVACGGPVNESSVSNPDFVQYETGCSNDDCYNPNSPDGLSNGDLQRLNQWKATQHNPNRDRDFAIALRKILMLYSIPLGVLPITGNVVNVAYLTDAVINNKKEGAAVMGVVLLMQLSRKVGITPSGFKKLISVIQSTAGSKTSELLSFLGKLNPKSKAWFTESFARLFSNNKVPLEKIGQLIGVSAKGGAAYIPRIVHQGGKNFAGKLPNNTAGRAYMKAYDMAVQKLKSANLKSSGVFGSLKEGRGRLGVWNRKKVSFEVASAVDKSPINKEFLDLLDDSMRNQIVKSAGKKVVDIRLSGKPLPSDIDLGVIGEINHKLAKQFQKEIYEKTGVLIEFTRSKANSTGATLTLVR